MFGDYLGIGAGAHGKITFAERDAIIRTSKPLAPARYLGSESEATPFGGRRFHRGATRRISAERVAFDRRRRCAVCSSNEQECRSRTIDATWETVHARGLVQRDRLAVTELGLRYLDTVVGEFI